MKGRGWGASCGRAVRERRDAREAWILRYQICSSKGRYYDRTEVHSLARKALRDLGWVLSPSLARTLELVLDDDEWLRRRKGYMPHALARELAKEAEHRYRLVP